MRDLAVLFLHLLATVARLAGPGGVRSVVAESVLVKHQLLILNRSRKGSPNLRTTDRVVAGLCAVFMRPGRLIRAAIVFKSRTLLNVHQALIQRKYRRLFSSNRPTKPGPKGPHREVIAAAVEMKQRNPSWGCPRIAQQITLAFGIPVDKDVVRRILAAPGRDDSVSTTLGSRRSCRWRRRTLEEEILRHHRSHTTRATELCGDDGQVQQREQEVPHVRVSLGQA